MPVLSGSRENKFNRFADTGFKMSSNCLRMAEAIVVSSYPQRSTSGTVYLKHIVSQWTQSQSKLHAVLHKESFVSDKMRGLHVSLTMLLLAVSWEKVWDGIIYSFPNNDQTRANNIAKQSFGWYRVNVFGNESAKEFVGVSTEWRSLFSFCRHSVWTKILHVYLKNNEMK